jgi:tetratricopeptide (TPR) repeat protein
MSLGEGIHPSEYDKLRIKDLQEFKFKTITVAFSEIQSGNELKGIALLEEAYTSPKEDMLKFCANINLILQLNPIAPENHKKIVRYAKEGIILAKKMGVDDFKDFLIITICNVFLVQNITSMGQLLFANNISKKNKGDFSLFYDMDIIDLYQIQEKINKKIQVSLGNLIKQNNIQGLVFASATLMDTIIYQVQKFILANEDYLKIETGHRRPFIENFEKFLTIVKDENSLQFGYFKLAQYYFWICNYEKAEFFIQKAIEISKKLGYTNNVVSYNQLLDDIKNKRNPSDPRNHSNTSVDDLTFAQFREATIRNLELQGIKIPTPSDDTSDDRISDAIRLGLEDIDPSEYLRYCEHLRVGYLYPSMLGRNIGLPTLGPKVIWCKNHGIVEGVSLKNIFSWFVEASCKKCDLRKSRNNE